MHTVIRRYQGVQNPAEVARRAVEEFAPTLRDQPGFQGYWVVDAGDGILATISVYDLDAGRMTTSVNLTMDVRNAVHGLEVWPFDGSSS